jgi:hypothetical protein
MPRDVILGYLYLRNGLFAIPAQPTQDHVLGNFSRPCGTARWHLLTQDLPPDFLHAALDGSACAAFFTESRMRLIDSTRPDRNPGPSWATLSRPYGTQFGRPERSEVEGPAVTSSPNAEP